MMTMEFLVSAGAGVVSFPSEIFIEKARAWYYYFQPFKQNGQLSHGSLI